MNKKPQNITANEDTENKNGEIPLKYNGEPYSAKYSDWQTRVMATDRERRRAYKEIQHQASEALGNNLASYFKELDEFKNSSEARIKKICNQVKKITYHNKQLEKENMNRHVF